MLFEYVGGGELFTYLRNAGRFDAATAIFYAAEIVLVFEYLHSLAIVYRDLKPENLLLDREGHLKICDFGFAKILHDRYDSIISSHPLSFRLLLPLCHFPAAKRFLLHFGVKNKTHIVH